MTAHLEDLGVMTRPPQAAADLNILENVRGIIKVKLKKMGLPNASCDQLWECVKTEWEKLNTDSSLVDSFHNSLPWPY